MENFDDFDNGFDEDEFMDDDSFEDSFDENCEPEDFSDDTSEMEDDISGDDVCDDEFTMEDAIFLGGAMGYAYEEGLEEAARRRLEKKMEDDRKNRDREDC